MLLKMQKGMTYMTTSAFKTALLREADALPERYQRDVLAYIRFLKIGLADKKIIEHQFDEALKHARTLAAEQGISDEDIAGEIQAVRAGR